MTIVQRGTLHRVEDLGGKTFFNFEPLHVGPPWQGPKRVEAPWSEEQVKSLNAYQGAGYVHPFTGRDGDLLIATSVGWIDHPQGPVVQTWAHAFMADWSWQDPAAEALFKANPK